MLPRYRAVKSRFIFPPHLTSAFPQHGKTQNHGNSITLLTCYVIVLPDFLILLTWVTHTDAALRLPKSMEFSSLNSSEVEDLHCSILTVLHQCTVLLKDRSVTCRVLGSNICWDYKISRSYCPLSFAPGSTSPMWDFQMLFMEKFQPCPLPQGGPKPAHFRLFLVGWCNILHPVFWTPDLSARRLHQ